MNDAQGWIVFAKHRALLAPLCGFVFEPIGTRFKGFGEGVEQQGAGDEREDDDEKADAEQQEIIKMIVERRLRSA